MCALRQSAIWPQLVAISLIGLWVAGCSADSGRFGEGFSSSSTLRRRAATSPVRFRKPRRQATSKAAAAAPCRRRRWHVGRRPRHGLLSAKRRSHRLDRAAPPPPPSWTWDGGTRDHGRAGRNAREHRARRTVCRSPRSWKQTTSPAPPASIRASTSSFRAIARRRRRERAGDARSVDRAVSGRAGCAARRAGRAAGRPCRGAGRNAQQHRAALPQAGAGALPTPIISPPTPG